jgi:hypothetical protein
MPADIFFPLYLIMRNDDRQPMILRGSPGHPTVFPLFDTVHAAAQLIDAMKLANIVVIAEVTKAEMLVTWDVQIGVAEQVWWNPTSGPKGLRRLRRTFVAQFLAALREQAEREKKASMN